MVYSHNGKASGHEYLNEEILLSNTEIVQNTLLRGPYDQYGRYGNGTGLGT